MFSSEFCLQVFVCEAAGATFHQLEGREVACDVHCAAGSRKRDQQSVSGDRSVFLLPVSVGETFADSSRMSGLMLTEFLSPVQIKKF